MKLQFFIDIEVPAEKAWHELSEGFGDTGKWTSLLDSSVLIGEAKAGSHRECRIGKKILTENITRLDHTAMQIDYDLIQGRPLIVRTAQNSWQVTRLGAQRSRVTMQPNMVMAWWALPLAPLLILGLKQSMPTVLEEFKHWAETGRVHPRKAKKVKKSKHTRLATIT